jgi:hypothetical protein
MHEAWAGNGLVRDYRVYYLDANGRVLRREVLRSENDERAIAMVAPPREEAAVELWNLGRLVKRFDGRS